MMKKQESAVMTGFIVLLLIFASGIIGNQDVYAKGPITLRLVQAAPAGDYPLTFKDMELAKRFNARANGEYVMEIYPGGALAKIPEFFDAVRIGAVEMADVDWGIYSFLDYRTIFNTLKFLSVVN